MQMMLIHRTSFNGWFAVCLLLAPVHGRAGPTLMNGTLLAACAAHRGPDGLFIRGLHHGGTSLLSKLIALHPDISPISSGKTLNRLHRTVYSISSYPRLAQ